MMELPSFCCPQIRSFAPHSITKATKDLLVVFLWWCGLPTAAARVRTRVWSCGICGGQSGAGAGFLRVLRFPLPIFIQPIAPQSPSSIIWGLYNRPEVAVVLRDLQLVPPHKKSRIFSIMLIIFFLKVLKYCVWFNASFFPITESPVIFQCYSAVWTEYASVAWTSLHWLFNESEENMRISCSRFFTGIYDNKSAWRRN
jgi:hypothetical protein